MKHYTTLDMKGNKIINCPSLSAGGDASLVEDITSNVSVGGAPAGTLFEKDMQFTDFAKKLLRTDIHPIISFSATNSGLREIGTSVSGTELKLDITNLSTTTSECHKIVFKKDGVFLHEMNFVEGQSSYSSTYMNSISSDTTFEAVLEYDNTSISKSVEFKFVYASYVAVVNDLNPSESDIKSGQKIVKNSRTHTWSGINLSNQRYCYAYPSSLGNLSSIKDSNNFEYVNSYTKVPMTIDGQPYNVYVLTDPVTITNAKQIYS